MNTSHQLNQALKPRSIALIGASDRPNSRGAGLWRNLVNGGFQGALYPINPKYQFLGEIPCYQSIKEIADPIDLVILATPAKAAEKLLSEIAQKGTRWVALAPSDADITSAPSWQAHIVNQARS